MRRCMRPSSNRTDSPPWRLTDPLREEDAGDPVSGRVILL